jgi:hypothetical protein
MRAKYFSTRSCEVTVPIRCAASSWTMVFSVTSKVDAGAAAGSGPISLCSEGRGSEQHREECPHDRAPDSIGNPEVIGDARL